MSINFEYPVAFVFIIPLAIFLIWVIRKNFIAFKEKSERTEYIHKKRYIRVFVIITRTLLFALLIIAIASPFSSKMKTIPGDYSVTILSDKSDSMQVFDEDTELTLKEKIGGKIPASIKYIAYGTESAIGDAILNNMQGNDNIILVSDGNSNMGKEIGDVMLLASSLNTTVSNIEISPVKNDVSISIDAPSEIIFGRDITYYIDVASAGEQIPYKIELSIDNENVYESAGAGAQTFEYKPEKWLLEGYHKVTAKLILSAENEAKDYFKQNNVFYKTIKVYPKPDILFLSERSPRIERVLERVYKYHLKKELTRPDLMEYPVVVIDDIPASKLNDYADMLSDYVSEGNGLVVLGGKNSFDYGGYKNSLIESILPVTVGLAGKEMSESDINIVIVIDISGTTTLGFEEGDKTKKISVQKAQALEIINHLKPDTRVGAVAFDTNGYYLTTKMLPLSQGYATLNKSIHEITSEPTAGTFLHSGLENAFYLLAGTKGSRNIIVISDGITSFPEQAIQDANMLAMRGIKTYAIGIGKDTNRAFMQALASAGEGLYFEPEKTDKMVLLFNTSSEEAKKSTATALSILDESHFITKNLEMEAASITGYNQVAPKSSARTLMVVQDVMPILTVWRFGLGRVAALSTDTEIWAGSLLSEKNSELITRAINWAIWDPERKKDFSVKTKDGYLGENVDVYIYSKNSRPSSEKAMFYKIGEDNYKATFTANAPGFYDFFEASVAINNPKEYYNLGFNQELSTLVTLTGGRTFTINQTDEIINFVKEKSKRTKTETNYYRWPFIAAALLLFLIEIAVRKALENRGK